MFRIDVVNQSFRGLKQALVFFVHFAPFLSSRFQCSRLRLKGFGAASSVSRCRFASDGIFDRFQLLLLFFLTPDTRHLNPQH
jgi:hypothetical protein